MSEKIGPFPEKGKTVRRLKSFHTKDGIVFNEEKYLEHGKEVTNEGFLIPSAGYMKEDDLPTEPIPVLISDAVHAKDGGKE